MSIRNLVLLAAVTLLFPLRSFSADQSKMSRETYIQEYHDDAVREMQQWGIPASITLAQACLESSDGNSPLAREANNHFGIKCADWTGATFHQDDDAPNECFRKYNHALESFEDHSKFLRNRPRYASLFELDRTDYKGWAHGLKHAGYATDPAYARRLIEIIETYQLYRYDEMMQGTTLSASNDKSLSAPPPPKTTRPWWSHANANSTTEAVNPYSERKVMVQNGVQFIVARKGDDLKSLSEEFRLGYWQLPKYNEMKFSATLQEGQVIYLQPKKRQGEYATYVVKEGDTVHSIAQATAIKSKFIREYNGLSESQKLTPGSTLKLAR